MLRQQGYGFDLADKRCDEFVQSSLSRLAASPPGTVIVANTDVYFWNDYWAVSISGSVPSTDRTDKAVAYEKGLRRMVKDLMRAGHQVLLIQPLPRFDVNPYAWSPRECTGDEVVEGRCQVDMPIAFLDSLQGDLRARLDRVAASESASVLDLRRVVCIDGKCSPASKDGWLYADPWHISVATSIALAPEFTKAIQGAPQCAPLIGSNSMLFTSPCEGSVGLLTSMRYFGRWIRSAHRSCRIMA